MIQLPNDFGFLEKNINAVAFAFGIFVRRACFQALDGNGAFDGAIKCEINYSRMSLTENALDPVSIQHCADWKHHNLNQIQTGKGSNATNRSRSPPNITALRY